MPFGCERHTYVFLRMSQTVIQEFVLRANDFVYEEGTRLVSYIFFTLIPTLYCPVQFEGSLLPLPLCQVSTIRSDSS